MRIEFGRQFTGVEAGQDPLPLFDDKGKLGGLLPAAAKKITAQENSIVLQDGGGAAVKLSTEDEWTRFLAENAATQRMIKGFSEKFGISFRGFVNAVDDLAMSDDKKVELNLAPDGAFAVATNLKSEADDYAIKLKKGDTIDLAGPATVKAEAVGLSALGPDLIAQPIQADYQRDRRENESWGDFVVTKKSWAAFKENTGVLPFTKLYEPSWKDAEAMALCERFNMPLHAELKTDTPAGEPAKFQDHYENFRETYFTDTDGLLDKLGISLRLRVRFEKNDPDPNNPNAPPTYTVRRTLIQVKNDRRIDPVTGESSVHKTEQRYWSDVEENVALGAVLTGKDKDGRLLSVMQKLYKMVADAGAMPADGLIKLKAESVIFQKRRRTHLHLDDVSSVKTRLDAAVKEREALTTATQPVPEALTKWITKLEAQHKMMTDAETLLQKYQQYMSSGECMILSADRYNVYDPFARSKQPVDLDDEQGRVGRGLHVEAEWDSASSDSFEKAIAVIDQKLAATPAPANADELKKDREALDAMCKLFKADVDTAEKVQTERLVAAGLKLDPSKLAKEDRADDMIAQQDNRAQFWHS